jgi:Mg/Co/Ni transporter MgtE
MVGDRPFLDWSDMEPFVGHVPTARLRFSHRKLANLHPAEIADLVEAASHEEGEEIIEAVGQDRELEADVFEELDEHHQLEFIRERPDAQVAAVVARMATDVRASSRCCRPPSGARSKRCSATTPPPPEG